jgi:hypothetical protein
MSTAGNLIYQETTTTGTGNITLTAKTGFRAFSDQFSVATPFWYAIRDQTTGAYEVGVGELSSASVLVRSSVIQSSNANALVNFAAGTKDVICDVPASIQNYLSSTGIKATTSAGVLVESNSGTDVALLGAGGGAGSTFYGGVNVAGTLALTAGFANMTMGAGGTNTVSLYGPVFASGDHVYTFPDFGGELGIISGIPGDREDSIAAFDNLGQAIYGLDTTTHPNVTEIAYVKGATSSIQTQLNAKAPTASPNFTGTVTLPAGQVVNGVTLVNGGTATLYLSQDGTYTTPPSGGSPAFNTITSGTNTTAAMVVGTGASIAASGSGTITATAAPLSGISGLGASVATALAVNVGSAGAFVVNGGALGTPSSGVATNLTGTASGLTAGNVTTNANLTGEVTSVGNAATLTNSAVIGKVLTGYTSGAGTVAATDTILQAFNKLNGNDALKVPYTGATANVDLGAFNLTATDISTALVTSAEFNFLTGLGQNVQSTFNSLLANFDNYVPYSGATIDLDLGANSLICVDVNGVALTTAGSSSQYLSADGTYSTPAGGSGLTRGQLQATISGVI